MKTLTSFFLALALCFAALPARAIGWPENYEGVMLQGFYWDSYSDTKWTNLESQADDLSKYFKLIWVPNSGKCSYMGYMPQYWFTNHNSAFGTEAQLLSMIKTFKAKGTGIIADCVINHRNGVTNWHDFPVEEWNGRKWQIGLDGICSNDEMAYASGQPKPTGKPDTGENFDGCRDLDHTNANVQDNCKNYVKCLQEKYGYAGMRYDMVKGYGGQYTKIYNEYANVQFSVGEYFDSNYDLVARWIDATGKTSAAFDFPCKYAINEAFASGDLRKLVWKANGTTDQPAGMIHYGYPRYAVTFVDNHDTARDGSAFRGNIVAANAFILFSPGTPCVFLPHYQSYPSEIRRMINIRNAAGIHNQSAVRVLRSSADCYMAEVTGKRGTVVVKIGSAWASPDGYTEADIKASGNDYCVWTKVKVEDVPQETVVPSSFYIIGEVNGGTWAYDKGVAMKRDGDTYTATVEFIPADPASPYCYFSFAKKLASSWDELNGAGNRFAPSADTDIAPGAELPLVDAPADAKAYKVAAGKYVVTVNFKSSTISLTNAPQGAVSAIEAAQAPAEFFTLQGVRVSNPLPGNLYIKRSGNKTEKILF